MSRHSTTAASSVFRSPEAVRRDLREHARPAAHSDGPARERARPACRLELTEPERRFLHEALPDLTRREREVILELCEGGTNEAMADRLCIALPTLRTHLMRLNQKLGATSKGDLVRLVAAVLLTGYRQSRLAPGSTPGPGGGPAVGSGGGPGGSSGGSSGGGPG
jgi:DNA-binding CsgD family transcriptional regulator